MKYGDVTSSWVAKLGWDRDSQVLCVGTSSGKVYKVSGIAQDYLDDLASRVKHGGSIGEVVSKIFRDYPTQECSEDEAIQLCGGGEVSSRATSKPNKGFRQFSELLLPHARTGLFSFA